MVDEGGHYDCTHTCKQYRRESPTESAQLPVPVKCTDKGVLIEYVIRSNLSCHISDHNLEGCWEPHPTDKGARANAYGVYLMRRFLVLALRSFASCSYPSGWAKEFTGIQRNADMLWYNRKPAGVVTVLARES